MEFDNFDTEITCEEYYVDNGEYDVVQASAQMKTMSATMTTSMNSKLVKGRIPPFTPCPFRSECPSAQPDVPQNVGCGHQGIHHTVAYSCGYARAFDLIDRNSKETS